jgi:hypothetical protein
MESKEYIDGLFSGYEETPELSDFKEELRGNLDEKIANLIEKKGMSHKEAFAKATAELGDISALADEISLARKKEVFSEIYMNTRSYMKMWQKIGYTAAGGLLAFGIIISVLAYLSTGDIVAGLGSLIVFFILPVCGFVFLGLTQETAANYPMSPKRACFYVAASCVILFGLAVSAMAFFGDHTSSFNIIASIGALIPFVLPGGAGLAFLILTEKSRHKPWFAEQLRIVEKEMNEQFADPYAATVFGLFSGALWIFAIALFVILGFLIGFRYSWPVFIIAVAAQLLVQAFTTLKNRKR